MRRNLDCGVKDENRNEGGITAVLVRPHRGWHNLSAGQNESRYSRHRLGKGYFLMFYLKTSAMMMTTMMMLAMMMMMMMMMMTVMIMMMMIMMMMMMLMI